MKRVYVLGMYLISTVVIVLATVGYAQQPAAQFGQDAARPLRFPSQPGSATAAQPGQASVLPQAVPADQPGIQRQQNISMPGWFDEQRTRASGLSAAAPAPAEELPTASHQAGVMSDGQTAQRGELGVWLAASGGPGVEVQRVTQGSAAAQAGLQAGDVVLQVNGQGAMTPTAVSQLIRSMPPGQTVQLDLWRNGKLEQLSVALQPIRETYQVTSLDPFQDGSPEPRQAGFRGEAATSSTGDLGSRTTRLEEHLGMVIKELRRMRQEMAQLRSSGAAQSAAGLTTPAATPEPGIDSGFEAIDQTATQPQAAPPPTAVSEPSAAEPATVEAVMIEEPATAEPSEPADESDPFADAAEPASEPAEVEPAATTEEPPAEEPPVATEEPQPATEEPATEEPAATEADAEVDSLFE